MSAFGRRPAGFTLLEVLVAITLLSMLIAMGYAAMRTATQSARSGEALIARTEELRTAQVFIRRQLTGLLNLPFEIDERTGTMHRFDGDAESIQFVASMPGYLSRGGPHVQRLSLVSDRDGYRLEFTHAQLNGFDPQEGFPEDRAPVVLIAGIADARFSFRARSPEGELEPWSSDWEDPDRLPEQVELEVEFGDDDPRRWVSLQAAPRVALAPARMTFDRFPGRPPANGGGTGVPRPEQ